MNQQQIETHIKVMGNFLGEHLDCHATVGFFPGGSGVMVFRVPTEKDRRALIMMMSEAIARLNSVEPLGRTS